VVFNYCIHFIQTNQKIKKSKNQKIKKSFQESQWVKNINIRGRIAMITDIIAARQSAIKQKLAMALFCEGVI
jgi:hypothetical protein